MYCNNIARVGALRGKEKETYGSILPLSHVFLCGCEIHFLFSGNVLQQQSKGFVIGEVFVWIVLLWVVVLNCLITRHEVVGQFGKIWFLLFGGN